MLVAVRTLVLALLATTALAQGVDLGERYPATKHHSGTGLGWTIEPEDVWALSSFDLSQGSGFELKGKGATLVLARNETNVLWGALFPEKPAKLRSPLGGDKETADEIFLRFAPNQVPWAERHLWTLTTQMKQLGPALKDHYPNYDVCRMGDTLCPYYTLCHQNAAQTWDTKPAFAGRQKEVETTPKHAA